MINILQILAVNLLLVFDTSGVSPARPLIRITLVGSQLSGEQIQVMAGKNLHATAVQMVADKDVSLSAVENINILAGTNHFKDEYRETKKTSGVFTGGGAGITFGSKSEKHTFDTEGWTQSDARSAIGSLSGNVSIQAGKHANVLGTDLITQQDNTLAIFGESLTIEAGKDRIESHESHEYKQSGLTIALSTPVTDAALAAYNTARQLKQTQSSRLQSLYAVKAATEIAQAAQNLEKVSATLSQLEQLDNLNKNAAAAENPAVKVSIGYGTSQQKTTTDTYSLTHDKSVLSAGNVLVTATDGKARFNGVDIQAENANINAKLGIDSQGVKDTYASHTTSKNSSASFGVFVGFNGDSFGIGLEGGASLGKGKTNIDSETWQNNHWNVKHLETNSEQGGFTLDAATIQADSWTGKLNSLTLQSRQDTEKYTSKNTQASASGSVAYGSGGGASASASYTSAKLDTAQVNEQTGIHLGKGGMDVTVNGHTQLNGAVITSEADAEHNKLTTQTLRATEIKNHSELKTESAAVGTGAMAAMTMAMSALGNQHDTNYSTTKSAVGANIALITEDKNAQNINRNTENTNEKVKKQDLAKAQENQEAAKLVGEIAANLVGIYTFKEREDIEKAKLAVGKLQAEAKEKGISQEDLEKSAAYQKAQQNLTALQTRYDDNYGIGSTKGRAIQAVTAALQGIAGGSIEQAAVGLASPYLNEQIKQWTTDKDGNVDKTANLAAHAILGAVEAQITGSNALAGAAAATTGEAAAMVITNILYNGKKAEELTENEKQNVVFLSQVASGFASAFIANDGTASAAVGSEIGKRAVENNYLFKIEAARKHELEQKARQGIITLAEQQELAAINEMDNTRDVKLVSSCVDKMSSACREESKQVDAAKISYSGSELNRTYGYPIYTAYSTKYEPDYKKVASFSEQYSILTASQEKTYADFEEHFGLPKGSVNKFTQWGDVIANTAGLIGTSNVGKSALSGDFSKSVPKEVNSGNKLDVVGETTNYSTHQVNINGQNIWSSTKKLSAGENLNVHWEKHKNEFPEFNNVQEYLDFTHNFIEKPPAGTLIKNRDNGDKLLYNPQSNIFISINKDGIPKTMFKPEAGINYWEKQK